MTRTDHCRAAARGCGINKRYGRYRHIPYAAGRCGTGSALNTSSVAGLLVVLAIASLGRADWPMAGHDPARSSCASQDKVEATLHPIWHRKIGPYIPSKVQIITVAAAGRVPALRLTREPC